MLKDDAWSYWLAGLFEGEGTISISGRSVTLAVTSTDYDVLDTLLKVSGLGHITREYRDKRPGKEHYKPFKRWEVRGIADCQRFLLRIRPYLHARRGARADELLAMVPVLDPSRPGRAGGKDPDRLCRAGLHPMNGKRYCYACQNDRRRPQRRKSP